MVGDRRRERSANNTKHHIDHRKEKELYDYDLWSEPAGPNAINIFETTACNISAANASMRKFRHKQMRTPGVEPGSQAWEACMMPLHYVRSRK